MSDGQHTRLAVNATALLRILAVALAVVVLADALVQALTHLRDLSRVNHITGEWMALTQALRDGVFYPPLEQDGHYGGTRYVPVFLLLIDGLVVLTGSFLVAAKLASFLSVAGLLGAVFAGTRQLTGRSADGICVAAAVLAFPEGWRALLSPHADALAVALSVAGVAVCVRERPGKERLTGAALLFALAMGTKFSSVAGPAAACLFVFRRDRRAGLLLAALTATLTAAGLIAINTLSDGRFLENSRALASGGMSAESLPVGPIRLAHALKYSSSIEWMMPLLLPAAAFALVSHARERRFAAWDWYLLFTWGTTALIFASPGTDLNHLLEPEVASVLVLATWLRPGDGTQYPTAELVGRGLFGAALLLALVRGASEWTSGPPADAVPPSELAAVLAGEEPILSEDPTIPVLLGRRPVILDAFAYRVLAERGRLDPERLAGRIRRNEFGALVLLRNLEDPDDPLNVVLTQLHFGPQVTRAMAEAYRFDRKVGAYYVFRPREAVGH